MHLLLERTHKLTDCIGLNQVAYLYLLNTLNYKLQKGAIDVYFLLVLYVITVQAQ